MSLEGHTGKWGRKVGGRGAGQRGHRAACSAVPVEFSSRCLYHLVKKSSYLCIYFGHTVGKSTKDDLKKQMNGFPWCSSG